jgi:hypothetical protein
VRQLGVHVAGEPVPQAFADGVGLPVVSQQMIKYL